MSSQRSPTARGVIGGVLAATTIVLFYLVVDAARGRPLQTPAILSGVLMGRDEGGVALIALYTVLHYLVFIAFGLAVAWVIDRTRAPVALLLGVVVGFLLFDVVFYASVAVFGVDVMDALGWPSFLAANLLAGLVLMGYLGRGGADGTDRLLPRLRDHGIVREGIIAGLIGGVTVAAWFFVLDLVAGALLYTPAALGSALFFGVDSAAGVQVTAGTVLGYTAIHFIGFIVAGLLFSGLVARAEDNPPLVMGLVLLFVTFETLLLGLVALVAAWLLDVLPWWSILMANLLAAGVMTAYLWRSHPHLRRDLARPDLEAPMGREPVARARGG